MSLGSNGGMGSAAPASGFQHERRFILLRSQAEAFIAAIAPRLTMDVYDLARPVAFTRTTYLDTDDLDFFQSCTQPVSRRLRVRDPGLQPGARGRPG